MREKTGGAPEKLLAGALLFLGERQRNRVERGVRLNQCVELGSHIAVVEAVEIDIDFFEKFEKHAHTLLGVGDGVRAIIPRHESRAATERIGKRVAHDMPVSGRKTQVIAHRLALDELVGVVMFESEGIFGLGALVGDLRNAGKVFGAHGSFFNGWSF